MYALNRHRLSRMMGRCLSLDGETSQIYLSKFLFCNIFFIRPIACARYKESLCLKLSALDDRGIFPSHRKTDAYTHTSNSFALSLSPSVRDERDEERERERKLLYGEESSIVSSLPSFFLPPLREGYPRDRRWWNGEKKYAFMYVRPIDSLLYGARGKRRLCWTPDAEESEAAAGAAGVVARTEMG